jgi:hypothetical protein
MSIEAMKQMVEALEKADTLCPVNSEAEIFVRLAIEEGRKAIAEAEKQEPIGCTDDEGNAYQYGYTGPKFAPNIKLYANPQPKREPLAVREIKRIATYCGEHINDEDVIEITRRVEAAHGIKGQP